MPAAAVGRATTLLAAWAVRARALRCISRSDAEVWRVRSPVGADLALRLYRGSDGLAAALDAELGWLNELCALDLLVPQPVAAADGRWRVPFDAGDGTGHAVLYRWLPGRMRFASLRPLHLRRVGCLIAQLHDNAQSRHRRGLIASTRRAWGPDLAALAQGPPRLRDWGGRTLREAVRQAAARLGDELASWPQDPAHWGWIHGDLHPWNLLFDGDRAGAIDFSDAGWGFLAQDLAAVLQFLRQPIQGHADHRPALPALQNAMFDGYASVRPVPAALERQTGQLHGMRLLNTLQWMLDGWASPADRPWGPAFVRTLPGALAGLR